MRDLRVACAFAVVMMVMGFCTAQEATIEDAPFLDPAEPMEVRIADLISRMTLEEKISQLKYDADGIPRLGILPYNWWNECLHGVARAGKATIFPQAIGLAATFDTTLAYDVASAISDEARVKFQQAQEDGNFARYRGLTFWTPNINIFRDPRWGRGQETYGEDPFLTSRMGTALVKGLQGDHERYLKVAACAKHYAVHSGPEALRHEFDAVVSDKDLWETYLPAFHALVDAGVETVMGAYNRTNHEVCCGSSKLLMDILRGQWGFKGHVVSDCWALQDIHQTHLVTKTPEESAALALKNGTDLNCGSTYGPYLKKAVDQKLITEADVDRALSRLLRTKMRLGLFDPPDMNPYTRIPASVLCSQAHKDLARRAAQESIVLLKNKNQCLPLAKNPGQVYIVGPMVANIQPLLGNYYGINDNLVTILEGITHTLAPETTVEYKPGSLLSHANVNPIDWYSGIAADADVTIAVVGLDNMLEGEEGESLASQAKGDREDLQLPANQLDLLRKLRKNAKQFVIVVTGGSPIALGEVHDMADALIFVWYPGEQGGQAVADVLFGDVAPSGKLPLTFPKSVAQLPDYADYAMTGRTYRYMTAEPLYPFGFGLSFTTFEYSRPRLGLTKIMPGQSTQISVTLTNTGELPGEEVAQLYITDMEASVPVPQYALKGFQRVSLEPGQRKTVTFIIMPDMLTLVNQNGKSILEPGEFKITIGGSCPNPRAQALGAAKTVDVMLTVGE